MSTTVGLGRVLFRFRSFTPVPVIAFLLWRLAQTRGVAGPGGPTVDAALDALGLAVAFAGQALRFYTLGQVPEGTSGQGSVLEATTLNTRGPYSYVRNPLYLGNLGIILGLLLIAHDVWVYVIALAFFFGAYFFIIHAEESFLRGLYGARYDEFCARVRRWVPRLTPAYEGKLRNGFDVRRALKKEHNPFTAWASGALVLIGWEAWARGAHETSLLAMLVALEAMVLVSFGIIKAYKRGLLWSDARG